MLKLQIYNAVAPLIFLGVLCLAWYFTRKTNLRNDAVVPRNFIIPQDLKYIRNLPLPPMNTLAYRHSTLGYLLRSHEETGSASRNRFENWDGEMWPVLQERYIRARHSAWERIRVTQGMGFDEVLGEQQHDEEPQMWIVPLVVCVTEKSTASNLEGGTNSAICSGCVTLEHIYARIEDLASHGWHLTEPFQGYVGDLSMVRIGEDLYCMDGMLSLSRVRHREFEVQ